MADVSVNVGVSGISQFKQGMSDAQASVKTLDAALKANEKQFKATGDAENHLAAQTSLLTAKMEAQQKIAKNAEQALKQMEANGVKQSSKAYQDMQRKLIEAQSAMLDTQMEIDNLGTSMADAAGKTDKLSSSLGGISKKMSLDQVISGVNAITGGLEAAGKKAVQLGQELFDSIMSSAKWADDTATQAAMFGIDIDTFQRMQKLVTNGMDTTVDAMLTAQSKLNKGIGKESKEAMDALDELGISMQTIAGKSGSFLVSRDPNEVFWEAGRAIMELGDAYEREAKAQALFGRSWKELVPLFTQYKSLDEYNEALQGVNVNNEDTIKDLAALNDKFGELQGNFNTLKTEIIGSLAPALTGAADALNNLLTKVMEYLQTPEGQQALEDMGKAVEGLFSDLTSIDPQKVVEGFTGVFDKVVGGLEWLSENSETVIGAMEAIVIGWGALKLTGGALDILNMVNGIRGLTGTSTAGAATSGAATGAAWGGAFANAVAAAAPWLIGLYTLLNPAGTAGNNQDVMTSNGQVTEAGWEFWNNNSDAWLSRLEMVGSHFGDLASILGNEQALQLVADVSLSDEDIIKKLQDEIGLVPISGAVALPENQAALLSQAVGTVEINGVMHMVDENGNNVGVYLEGGEPTDHVRKPGNYVKLPVSNANGLWSVPFDGYTSVLHKGERILPAREVSSRTFSSNLYVENMNMSGGMTADALAAAIAGRNRRMMAGYGS